jgi:3-hydroxyisobutyrate dehydrogenase
VRVAFLGLGIMGSRMAANLAAAGHEVVAWTRTEGKAEAWASEHGARAAATPAEAARDAEAVISMVVDGGQVERVLLAGDGAASTIAPADARAIAGRLADRELPFVDAPVTGSSPKAEAGTLTIMAGGTADDVERLRPLFEAMGQLIVHVGPVGHGQVTKVINNAMSAANAVTVAQALVAGQACGVDLDALVRVVAAGSGGSAMLDLKSGPMRAHDYATLFKLEHMLKDVRLCLDATREAGVPFPAAAEAAEVLAAAAGRGHGEDDFAALVEVVEALAGVRLT